MSLSRQEIEERLYLGEDSRWEFKEVELRGRKLTRSLRGDLADEIAAFANTDGGVLLCGVTDAGEAQGLSRDQMDALEKEVTAMCNDSIKPPINSKICRLKVANGELIVLVDVPPGYVPHKSPGGYFHRIGSSKRGMTSDEVLRLAERRGQARFLWFDKQPVPDTGFNTLEEGLWKPLLSAEGAADPKVALERMGLLVNDENQVLRASVAGVLLCCESPEEWLPNACITATCYRGQDRASSQIDERTIIGPLHRQVADAVAFAVRNMRVSAHKAPAREEVPQYSKRALFEAVVNAVVHRDYAVQGSRISLSMFDDRLEIQSPGSLPNGMTVDSLGHRQSTRNEVLVTILGRVPVSGIPGGGGRRYLMERRGDGIPIIQRETGELSGQPAKFDLVDGADLRLTLPAASLEPRRARAKIAVRCGSRAVAGVDLLVLFPNKTWKQVGTNEGGEAEVELHSTHLPMTVFAAAPGYEAQVERQWIPEQGALALAMRELSDGGSIIFPEGAGVIPDLAGRLNPICDSFDRTYLYASNLSVNEGMQQPVHFTIGENLSLTDADGRDFTVRVIDIVGRAAILDYHSLALPAREREETATDKKTVKAKAARRPGDTAANVGYEAELWKAADMLRGSMDAAEYKHVVLGLIFLKYISDAFEEKQAELEAAREQGADPEDRDEYRAASIFWVPPEARWKYLKDRAKQSTIGRLVDDAMVGIERDNPVIEGVLPKDYARLGLDKERLGRLIDLISNIRVGGTEARAKDVLGRIYEYFLSQFASAEGKKGGEFYTPHCIVKLLVEMLEPYRGRVYDPCCGSSGMFVQSMAFINAHANGNGNGGKAQADISIYGQESNFTTWRLAKMNLAIRGIEGQIAHGDTFHNDRHPDLRADFVLANPPFNVSDWGGERLRNDMRWKFGAPPKSNANYAWLQHIHHHLAPGGTAGVVLANGSMSSRASGEGNIRKAMIEGDVVDCMIALPGQLFYSTQIPACLWFLARDKNPGNGLRDRRGEVLFIDARLLGHMTDRTRREFAEEDIEQIARTYHAWRGEPGTGDYGDVPGFCKAATLEEIERHGHVLAPGRYVGAPPQEDDGEPFQDKMQRLAAQLDEQQAKCARLEAEIVRHLKGLGYWSEGRHVQR